MLDSSTRVDITGPRSANFARNAAWRSDNRNVDVSPLFAQFLNMVRILSIP